MLKINYCYYNGSRTISKELYLSNFVMNKKYRYVKSGFSDRYYIYYEANKNYLVYTYEFKKYFLTIDQYRENKINQIINE